MFTHKGKENYRQRWNVVRFFYHMHCSKVFDNGSFDWEKCCFSWQVCEIRITFYVQFYCQRHMKFTVW